MSTAAAFVSVGSFPFCLGAIAEADDVVSDLTLAQVMEFFWNLETFTLTFTGTTTEPDNVLTGDFGQTATVFPPAGSATDQGRYFVGALFPTAASVVAFASLPQDPKTPVERVCAADAFYGFRFEDSARAGTWFIELIFRVYSDFTNAGKYAIQYSLEALFTTSSGGRSTSGYFQDPSGGSGGTLGNSGTFTIGGIVFPWEFYHDTGHTFTGGTLSASSTMFTY